MVANQAGQQQELEIRAQQLQDQAATTAAMKNWDGKDYDALSKSVLQNGGSANAATAIQQHGLTLKKTVSDIAMQDATTGSKNLETFIGKHKAIGDSLEGIEQVPDDQLHATAVDTVNSLAQGGILDPQTAQRTLQGIQSIQDPKALRQQIDVLAKSSMGAKAAAEQAKSTADTRKANADAAAKEQESAFYAQNPSAGAPGVPAETVSLSDFLRKVPGASPANYAPWKAKQEAAATQPYKIQTAEAEAKAHQLIQGMEKPVYAMKPDGSKELMSATDALQAGIRTMLPVGAKEVGDDTQLINRLGDVRQKLARYEQAMSNLGATVSAKDQGNIAALIGKGAFKAGAFGTELPLDRLNATLQRENISNLSPDAKKLLVAYYNARESMQGYQRVLSGTGRANEKAMELNLDALPSPAISDKSYAQESFSQFRENLDIVGQGLPKIPGIKSPEEIEARANGRSKKDDPLGIR